jgi:hypothetical protein
MPAAFSPKDKERLLRWLSHGVEMAREQRGERATHVDVIWCLIQNAVLTMDRSPDQERRWLTSGYRSGGWNSVGLTYTEARQLEALRCHAAMVPYDTMRDAALSAHEQDRALDVMTFLRWCGVYIKSRKPEQMRKAAIALAKGGDCNLFRLIWVGRDKDITRSAVSKFRQVLAGHILAGLREECGIVPAEGLSWR